MFEYPPELIAVKNKMRAYSTARRISEKPSMIKLKRNGAFLDAQRVRIEGVSGTQDFGNRVIGNADTYERGIVIFGVKDHATLDDLDIAINDEFGYQGSLYIVTGVTYHSGEVQASAKRLQG